MNDCCFDIRCLISQHLIRRFCVMLKFAIVASSQAIALEGIDTKVQNNDTIASLNKSTLSDNASSLRIDALSKACKHPVKMTVDLVDPIYPKVLLSERVEGKVEAVVTISESGFVSKIDIAYSDDIGFENAVKASVLRSRFNVMYCDSIPVAWKFRKRYNFEIQ